jgi:hypothetical protein
MGGFPIQIFKIHFIRIFRSNFFPLFSGPWAWVGLLGGPAAAARVRAAMRGTKKHPEQQPNPLRLQLLYFKKYLVLKSLRKI